MNQKGEITLISCLIILAFSSFILLAATELRFSFNGLKRRTELFLCTKEVKGELHQLLKFTGRTNWAIKNTKKLSLVMAFIPGLQGAAVNTERAREFLKRAQDLKYKYYLSSLLTLQLKGCPVDPAMYRPPWKLSRNADGSLELKEKKWRHDYFSRPSRV